LAPPAGIFPATLDQGGPTAADATVTVVGGREATYPGHHGALGGMVTRIGAWVASEPAGAITSAGTRLVASAFGQTGH